MIYSLWLTFLMGRRFRSSRPFWPWVYASPRTWREDWLDLMWACLESREVAVGAHLEDGPRTHSAPTSGVRTRHSLPARPVDRSRGIRTPCLRGKQVLSFLFLFLSREIRTSPPLLSLIHPPSSSSPPDAFGRCCCDGSDARHEPERPPLHGDDHHRSLLRRRRGSRRRLQDQHRWRIFCPALAPPNPLPHFWTFSDICSSPTFFVCEILVHLLSFFSASFSCWFRVFFAFSSLGMYVANRASDKITQLTDNVYVCRSGSVISRFIIYPFVIEYCSIHLLSDCAQISAMFSSS